MINKFISGDIVGEYGVIYLEELKGHKHPRGTVHRVCKFRCNCGNEFITQLQSVKRGLTKSCGCLHKKNRPNKEI